MLVRSGDGPRTARDRALLLLGFASGLRRSEIASLDLADVRIVRAGFVLQLRKSKTDQEGDGRTIGIHRGKLASTCPARALTTWIAERGRWPGPLFCRPPGDAVMRSRLSGAAVADVVKSAATRCGLDSVALRGALAARRLRNGGRRARRG